MISIENMLPFLRCPRTGTALLRDGDELFSEKGGRYPIVNGKPILVRSIREMHVTPPEERVVSQNINELVLGAEHSNSIRVLNLGSGNVPCKDPRVISMDVLPNTNVDIVAEAEALPFADRRLDHVMSRAVFEHVHDPLISISQIRRTLNDGGKLYIDTAFMHGYHAFSGHYFN